MASPQQATAVAAAAVAESHAAQQQQQSQSQHASHPAQLKLENLEQSTQSSAPASSATTSTAPAQSASAAGSSPTGQNQTCKWSNPICREIFSSPEDLYTHLTEVHVGRKSNNNLNLTCRWEQCNTTVIKRDHITSHLRVHVALKPHTCQKCNKSFKRPQDLKKHIKTHADDSGAGQGQGHAGASNYGPMAGQSNGTAFYGTPMASGGGMGFPFQQQTGGFHPNYTQSGAQMHTGFAGGNYWTPQAGHTGPQPTSSFSLHGLLGAHRAHEFNSNDYSTWRHQLDGAFEPMHQPTYGMSGGHGGVAVAQPYQNPHELAASLRSKNDLSQVHAMLKEMHQAALNHQPVNQGFPRPKSISDHGGSPDMRSPAISAMNYDSSRSTTSPTPSLTPGSSVHSYSHSPAHEYVLPSTQAQAVSYPSLTGISTGPVGPALGAQYEQEGNFRHHAERLGAGQAQRATPRSEGSSDSDSALDPALRAAAPGADTSRDGEISREHSATPTVSTPRAEVTSEGEKVSQQIDLIKSLMGAIQERLEKGQFENENQEEGEDQEMTDVTEESDKAVKAVPVSEPNSSNPTYPPLPMAEY